MLKSIMRFAARFCIVFCLLFINLTYSASSNNSSLGSNTNNFQSRAVLPEGTLPPKNQTNINSLSSSELGWNGPLSVGFIRDDLYHFAWNVQYTQRITDAFALSALYEYAKHMYRFGGTFGFAFLKNNLFKFSAERLSEVLPFAFESGDINKRIAQNAFGIRYEYATDNSFLKNINFGLYYAQAQSKKLASIEMTFDDMNAINDRHIAGGRSRGIDVGADVDLTKYTEFNGNLFYDSVTFDTIYEGSSHDTRGLGLSLGINQLLGKHCMFGGTISKRKIYNTYTASISCLPPYISSKLGLEVSLLAERITSHIMPSDNSIGLKLNFNPGTIIGSQDTYYQLPGKHRIDDINIWTSKPAVHMEQVLAVADQRIRIKAPIISLINPTSGPTTGGNTVSITGNNFIGTSSVTFGGIAAPSFSVIDANTIEAQAPAHAAGSVAVIVTNPGGSDSATMNYVYTMAAPSNAPSIDSITPTSSQLGQVTKIIIDGKNFVKGATVAIGSLATTVNAIESNKISITLPAFNGTAGKVDVTVTNPDGSLTKMPGGFTYLGNNSTPSTNGCTAYITPSSGPNTAGNLVTIHNGSGFTTSTTIDLYNGISLHKTITSAPGDGNFIIADGGTTLTFTLPAGGTGYSYISTINPTTCNQPFSFYYHAPNQYVIQSSAGAGGTISPLGITTIRSSSTSVTYTMIPDIGYQISDVSITDGAGVPYSVGAVTTYTFSAPITQDHTIYVTFKKIEYTITPLAGSGGSISPNTVQTVPYGTNGPSFTITADSCYSISDIKVDGSSLTGPFTSPYVYSGFTNVTTNHTIEATFAPIQYTITSSVSGGNGSISPTPTATVNCGENQTFNFSPDSGYTIDQISIDGGAFTTYALFSYTFTNVQSNHTIAVKFKPDVYDITASIDGAGTGTITDLGTTSVVSGSNKDYTITANAGSHIASIKVNGSEIGTPPYSSPYVYHFVNVTSNQTIAVTFEKDILTITPSANAGGTISPSTIQNVLYGEDGPAFTITAADTCHFISDIKVDGISLSGPFSSPYIYSGFTNVTTNHTIEATFAPIQYTITSSVSGGNGSISPTPTATVNCGENQTFNFSPDSGYTIDQISIDGGTFTTYALFSYTFTNVQSNHTIAVKFKPDVYDITASIDGSGTGTGTITDLGTTSVVSGSNKDYTMTANAGSHISSIKVNGSEIGTPPYSSPHVYHFINVTSNQTITVKFDLNYTIIGSVSSGPSSGSISPTSASVIPGDNQTFDFSPAVGYHISTISIDGGAPTPYSSLSYTFTNVTTNHTIAIAFALDEYTITTSTGPNGTIDPSVTVSYGGNASININANAGYVISEILVNGISIPISGFLTTYTYNFTNVTENQTIHALFSNAPTVTIEASASSGGSISDPGITTLPYGAASKTYYMTSEDSDDVLLDVIVDDESIGPIPPDTTYYTYTFPGPITSNHTIVAKFEFHTASVTATAGPNGTIAPIGTTFYREDSEPTYTIIADPDHVITNVIVDGQPVPLTSTVRSLASRKLGATSPTEFFYTFDELEHHHTIHATFDSLTKVETIKPTATFLLNDFHNYLQKRHNSFDLLDITPNRGSVAGDDTVVIKFNRFKRPPTHVFFGNQVAKIITAEKDSVTIKTPPHSAGQVDIKIANQKESVILPNQFTYVTNAEK